MSEYEVGLLVMTIGLFIWTTYLHVRLFHSSAFKEEPVDMVEALSRLEGRQQETLAAVSSIQQVLIALTKPKA